MGRIKQKKAKKGSLKWTQHIINDAPEVLNKQIYKFIGSDQHPLEWLSPLKKDNYAEYRDQAFLDLLEINLKKTKLKTFWPSSGPQWDALGKIENKAYFLVESMAHVDELISSSSATAKSSKTLIIKSLNKTKKFLAINKEIDLSKQFYQYANRLAHLFLLRQLNDIPAYLVFVYFINDATHIAASRDMWSDAIQLLHAHLGISDHKLKKYIIDVFIDVNEL